MIRSAVRVASACVVSVVLGPPIPLARAELSATYSDFTQRDAACSSSTDVAASAPMNSEYRHAEFERRKSVEFAGISTWITSREDLILSKIVWARDTDSEMQLRDVRTLIDESVDWLYLKDWAAKLGIAAKLDELSK
jgi:hypothetical protein